MISHPPNSKKKYFLCPKIGGNTIGKEISSFCESIGTSAVVIGIFFKIDVMFRDIKFPRGTGRSSQRDTSSSCKVD
jgi:hypothetical protein